MLLDAYRLGISSESLRELLESSVSSMSCSKYKDTCMCFLSVKENVDKTKHNVE